MSRAMGTAADIFERDIWTVGDEAIGPTRFEALVGSDSRATAVLAVQFVAARRMTCESQQAGLLGRRQVETMVAQLSSAEESATVARAMMSSFEQRSRQLGDQRGSGITVGTVRTKRPSAGGELQRLDIEINGAGKSTMICASIGPFVVTVLVADGDPYADGGTMLRAIPMERFAEKVMEGLAGK